MQLNNTFALITGAGSGLGAATAHYLSKKGMEIAVLDAHAARAQDVAKQVNGIAFTADVRREKDIQDVFEALTQRGAECRVCVNCAGIAPAARLIGRDGVMPLEDFSEAIDINLTGTFNVMRLAAEHMHQLAPLTEDQQRGVIINTASIAAFEGQLGQVAYAASKGGVAAMTLPAARELQQWGIRVMCIAPGLMNTPMLHNMPEKVQASLAAQTVFPKRLGEPDEFAQLVAQIIENDFLNGCVLRLDGGVRL